MRYFNYAGLSPTRAEAVEAMQVASDEFRTQLFSESASPGTVNKQMIAEKRLLSYFTLSLAMEAVLSPSFPMPRPRIESPCLRSNSVEAMPSSHRIRSIRQHYRRFTA